MTYSPSFVAEDFSLIDEKVPSFQLGIGSQAIRIGDFPYNGDTRIKRPASISGSCSYAVPPYVC